MTALKLGIEGLEIFEINRIKILLRLLGGVDNFFWVYSPEEPYDAVLTNKASSFSKMQHPVTIEVLAAGSHERPGALVSPIDTSKLEMLLVSLQNQLQPVLSGDIFPKFQGIVAKQSTVQAVSSVAEDGRKALSVAEKMPELYKLKKWPPQAVLQNNKERIRLANLLSRKSLSIDQLELDSGIAKTEIQSFIKVLQSLRLVMVNVSPLSAVNHGISSVDRTCTFPIQGKAKRSLVLAIRRKLGI